MRGIHAVDVESLSLVKRNTLASDIGYYRFGHTNYDQIKASGMKKAFFIDENPFTAQVSQLSVYDRRTVPIGWSRWANFDHDGSNTSCKLCCKGRLIKVPEAI